MAHDSKHQTYKYYSEVSAYERAHKQGNLYLNALGGLLTLAAVVAVAYVVVVALASVL